MVGVFVLMFVVIVGAVLWFTRSASKLANRAIDSHTELQKKRMEIYNKHFTEMVRIECPYCRTLYAPVTTECPNCGAETKKDSFSKNVRIESAN